MTDYDDLFEETAPSESVFADKRALDPLQPAEEIVAREAQQTRLAQLLNGVNEAISRPKCRFTGRQMERWELIQFASRDNAPCITSSLIHF